MKVYIATRRENHEAHNVVRDTLIKLGHTLTYDWTTHGPAWPRGIRFVREVMAKEQAGVQTADLVIVLLPGGKGTHVELGLALASNVPVWIVEDPSETEPLSWLEAKGPFCGFWVAAGVERYFKNLEEMFRLLRIDYSGE